MSVTKEPIRAGIPTGVRPYAHVQRIGGADTLADETVIPRAERAPAHEQRVGRNLAIATVHATYAAEIGKTVRVGRVGP